MMLILSIHKSIEWYLETPPRHLSNPDSSGVGTQLKNLPTFKKKPLHSNKNISFAHTLFCNCMAVLQITEGLCLLDDLTIM